MIPLMILFCLKFYFLNVFIFLVIIALITHHGQVPGPADRENDRWWARSGRDWKLMGLDIG